MERDAEEAVLAAQRLAIYGDQFLAMMDDADERAEKEAAEQAAGEDESLLSSSSELPNLDCSDEEGDARAGVGDEGRAATSGPVLRVAPPRPQVQDRALYAAERKAFMTSKPKASGAMGQSQTPGKRRDVPAKGAEGSVSKADFLQMQREVFNLGATGLDKKARKAFDAGTLRLLGAKAESKPRIPANIGLGMAKKKAQRDSRATEEAIAAGMLSVRDLAKKRRREAEAARMREPGLREDGGAFRNGIMRVKPAPRPARGGGASAGKRKGRR